MHLINCEVSMTLPWPQHRVLTRITTQAAVGAQGNNPARPAINVPTNAAFKTTENCMYQLLLYQLKIIRNSWNNREQDLKELLNGITIGQK